MILILGKKDKFFPGVAKSTVLALIKYFCPEGCFTMEREPSMSKNQRAAAGEDTLQDVDLTQ